MSIGGRIKRVHQLDVLERLDKKNPKLAQEPVLNRRRHAVDNSSSANWLQDKTTVTNGDITLEVGSRIIGYKANGIYERFITKYIGVSFRIIFVRFYQSNSS